ncbi:DUF5993 family protein [Chitinophaga parva]|uniref:DUF5993 family protein n=1 Tax=Chitinophaga parva TaxID=2169414 RepID=UPI0014026EFE|nr:DUF5993 family protein [Chitinophaga parva]
MMIAPFFLLSIAIWAGYKGWRKPAIILMIASLLLIGWIWNYHMTSHLDLQF